MKTLDCICGITYSLHQHFFSSRDGLQKSRQNLSTKFGKYFWRRWPNIFSSKHPKCGCAAEICDWVSHCHIMQFVHTLCHHCVINNLLYKNWSLAFQMNITYKVLTLAVCPSVCQSRHYRPYVSLHLSQTVRSADLWQCLHTVPPNITSQTADNTGSLVCHLPTNIMNSIVSRCLHCKSMPGVSLRKKDGTWTLKQSWREISSWT